MLKITDLPSVLIQDPRSEKAYVIGAEQLARFEMTTEKLVYVDEGIVTFSIPADDFVETTPPFNATGSEKPGVMIQHEAAEKSYFLTYHDLQEFVVEQPSDYGGYGVSFVIPAGNEFLEDLSPAQYAMLQSGEAGGPTHDPSPSDPDPLSITPVEKLLHA